METPTIRVSDALVEMPWTVVEDGTLSMPRSGAISGRTDYYGYRCIIVGIIIHYK